MQDSIRAQRRANRLTVSIFEMAEVICSAVLVIALMFTFIVRFAGVVGSSMLPTLRNRDWLAVTSSLQNPRHRDIVIISPGGNLLHEPLVKRVVAVEGDVVDIREGRVWVNDRALEEPFLMEGALTEPAPDSLKSTEFPAEVPRGYVFVLGDNRGNSTDSRFADVGFIRADDILGKVLLRLKPSLQWFGSEA